MVAFKFGFLLSMSLVIAIGTQNLFIIRQGLLNRRPYFAAFVCLCSDALLILFSVSSLSLLLSHVDNIKGALIWAGIAFLVSYGCMSFRDIFRSNEYYKSYMDGKSGTSLLKIALIAVTFSILNPQAIVETIVIIGGRALDFRQPALTFYVLGTIFASFVWLFSLATIAKFANNFLQKPNAWRVLSVISASAMFYCSFMLFQLLKTPLF